MFMLYNQCRTDVREHMIAILKGWIVMKIQQSLYDVNEREQRKYARVLRLRRERRRKCLTMAVVAFAAFCMVLICTISYSSINSNANDGFKYYTSITAESGESLWDIADDYMDGHYDSKENYIAEVRSINHLGEDETIIAGRTLIVPYYSSEYVQ